MFHNAPRSLERDLSNDSTLTTATPSLTSSPSPTLAPMFSPGTFSRAESPALSDDSASSLGLNDFSLDFQDFAQEAVSPPPATEDLLDFFDFGKDDGSAPALNGGGSSDLVFNDALTQLVAGYGFGTAATLAAAAGGNGPPAGMQMLFSPVNTNLIVNQAIVPPVNVQQQRGQAPQENASTASLLDALTSAAVAAVSQGDLPQTASPAQLLHAPQEPVAVSVAVGSEPTLTVNAVETTAPAPKERKKRKRIMDPSKLLPLDAPVQPKTYHGPSATARKPLPTEIDGEDDGEDADGAEFKRAKRSPSVAASTSAFAGIDESTMTAAEIQHAKRLQNTLAARRSRHRKAEELRQLHETIEFLKKQGEEWKRRYEGEKEENERLKREMGIA